MIITKNMMEILNWIVFIAWASFFLYWAISAVNVKKDIGPNRWRGNLTVTRFAIAIIALIFVVMTKHTYIRKIYASREAFGPIFAYVGTVLVVLGVAFAIWARRHLGRNWSSYPTFKEKHELVTSGPYKFVRHPIYTGMLAAIFGTAFVAGTIWFIPFVIALFIFIRRVHLEEKIMMQQFPDKYPEYKKRTKALIPFLW